MRQRVLFLTALVVAILAEWTAATLAYHTIGEIISGLLILLIGLNLIPLTLHVARQPRAAWATLALVALLLVPYQVVLGARWLALHAEAEQIVAHAEQMRRETGSYPTNLAGYTFQNGSLRPYFTLYNPQDGSDSEFLLSYSIGTPSTSHSYVAKTGTWFYYPD